MAEAPDATIDPATPQADPPSLPPAAPDPGPRGLYRITAVVATIGVVVALLGLLVLARPVSTPTQDCGTAIVFILDGRTNVYVDPEQPPKGITATEARANNERPCRVRVADAAKPGGVMLLAGMVTALGAAAAEFGGRGIGWFRRHRAARRQAAAQNAPAG